MQVLVIGSMNSEICKAVEIAKNNGAKVFFAFSEHDGIESIRGGQSADVIVIDIRCNIKHFVDSLQKERIVTKVIACGLNASPKDAAQSIHDGAQEFMPLPPDENMIAAIFAHISSHDKVMVCKSDKMKYAISIADKISKSDAHVLITGESGTGKEVMAHYIHNNSNRFNKSFVRLNCAAIPDNLLESELFGHEKGAFTGAIARRIGKFEESSGGTLMLDEISEMDVRLQAKLLRAIQEQEIDRLGGNHPIKVNLRIIATSNRNLLSEVSNGKFREDLYFRLNVININLPRLADRIEDLPDLVKIFINKYCNSNGLPVKSISDDAMNVMLSHNWSGNIRELENTIHRAVLLSAGNIIHKDELLILSEDKNHNPIITSRNTDEHMLILNAINYCMGDLNQASHILGVSINTLSKKLHNNLKEYVTNT
jgi:DNA-binding NtrC family response regulator